jgi:hypothetical protein
MVKRYPLFHSRLYCLRSKKRLAALLNTSPSVLRQMVSKGNNYRVFSIPKGNGKFRDIEEPKGELKRIHARLFKLLSRIETPAYLHSGIKGCSYVTNAATHVGSGAVVKTDISSFYKSTTHRQVFVGFLREFKCCGDVAKLIADLCTFDGHVPTGSAVSMPIAFYAHKQTFDQQYTRAKAEGNAFTVYVDDLTLSGEEVDRRSLCAVMKTLRSTGLKCHKTRSFRGDAAKLVTGIIVTEDGVCLPNRRHHRIAKALDALEKAPSRVEREEISRALLGQINEAANVEMRFKRRRAGLKKLVDQMVGRG